MLGPRNLWYVLPFVLGFNGDGFIDCLKQLLRIDKSWIPEKEGYSMYIRPTAIATTPFLGVHASEAVSTFEEDMSFEIDVTIEWRNKMVVRRVLLYSEGKRVRRIEKFSDKK